MNAARLGIAGVGLIGGSIALRARAARTYVLGYDRDAATLARALARGALDATTEDLMTLAAQCDTLVIALPVDATAATLAALAEHPGPALIIDVASVKAPFVAVGSRVAAYVGTHPMAGRERSGIDAADPHLFENATWAYAPHREAGLVGRVRDFIAAMGALPLEIDPIAHDEIVALTSHLPQTLSVLLGAELAAAARDDGRVAELCGPGMLSMLRLARSPEVMWSPIIAANAAPLAARLRSLADTIDTVATALEAGESELLMSYFEAARLAAKALEERFAPTTRSSAYRSAAAITNPTPPHTR